VLKQLITSVNFSTLNPNPAMYHFSVFTFFQAKPEVKPLAADSYILLLTYLSVPYRFLYPTYVFLSSQFLTHFLSVFCFSQQIKVKSFSA